MKSFDEKLCICETSHKHLNKNEIPCQAVCNKIALDPIPDESKNLSKLGKVFISQKILFKKIAIMCGKGKISKIKTTIYNIPIKIANICNILPRTAVFIGLAVVKLNQDLKYRVIYILNQFVRTLYTRRLLI